jgi:hypothetical protein
MNAISRAFVLRSMSVKELLEVGNQSVDFIKDTLRLIPEYGVIATELDYALLEEIQFLVKEKQGKKVS